MNRKEADCQNYRVNLAQRRERLAELEDRGTEALSRYDREIAFQGDVERGLAISKWLVRNQIRYYEEQLLDCPEPVQQITLWEAPDAHLEAAYEEQQSGGEDQ